MSAKNAMKKLLELTPEERAKFKPSDGFEEVAFTYLSEAIREADGAMLKWVMEISEEVPEEGMSKKESSLRDTLTDLRGVIEGG